MRYAERGSSLIEVLIALTILSVGVLGLTGTGAMVSRMLGDGRWSTITMGHAQRRLSLLRAGARDSAGCASLSGGTAALPGGLVEQWTVHPGLRSVAVEEIISSRVTHSDTVFTVLPCF